MPFAVPTLVSPLLAPCAGWLHGSLLAATLEISDSVNRWYRRSSSVSENGIWILIVLAIMGLWVGLYCWDRSRKPRKRATQDREGLFLQLCDLHQLSKADRQLLRAAARTQNLDQPGLAFVNPQVLKKHVDQYPHDAKQAQNLLDRLFGDALMEEIVEQSGQTV